MLRSEFEANAVMSLRDRRLAPMLSRPIITGATLRKRHAHKASAALVVLAARVAVVTVAACLLARLLLPLMGLSH